MNIDAGVYESTIDNAARAASRADAAGYDRWWAIETQLDAFLASAVAAERTERIEIGTAIAVAFARNPMTVAMQANDLQLLSNGRFCLGLGSQVKPHVTRRFSMPWSRPAARMREFVLAVRAIWETWATDAALDFRGEFYTHTLMTPMFNPGPNPHGIPKIMLAGVGPLMTEVAGEVADGLICHGFSTERYLREVTVPALLRGREKAGLSLKDFEISAPGIVVARDSEDELNAAVRAARTQIAFYGSTPAYRPVLELHGWGDLQDELTAMTRRGEWDSLADAIDDEVLHTFAIVGTTDQAVAEIDRRYGDIATRITLDLEHVGDADRRNALFGALRRGTTAQTEA